MIKRDNDIFICMLKKCASFIKNNPSLNIYLRWARTSGRRSCLTEYSGPECLAHGVEKYFIQFSEMLYPIRWLSEKIPWECTDDPEFTYKIVDFYTKFQFKNIIAEIGDFVLISNADAAEPDTVEGCDIGQIVKLYESHDKDLEDRFRARVQWFCKFSDIPKSVLNNTDINIEENLEIVEDHRPYDQDVSIETFFKKCDVLKMPTIAVVSEIVKTLSVKKVPTFICRYRLTLLSKRKCILEPVLEDERKEFSYNYDIPKTPRGKKRNSTVVTPSRKEKKSPPSIIRDSWVVKNVGSAKLTLMRDITNDHSPRKDFSKPAHIRFEDEDATPSKRSRKPNKKYYSNDSDTENVQSNSKTKKTPVKISPKRCIPTMQYSDSDEDFILKTPKKSKKTLFKNVTPSISNRKTPVKLKEGALQTARESLHVSAIPLSLPCREEEFNDIYSFINRKITECEGGCMYISGVPGTGKTATVMEVIRCLKKQVAHDKLPKFDFVEINGMRLTEPRQAYVHVYKQLTGKSIAWEQACKFLENRFTKPAPRRCATVILVDELDVLCNRRQDVLYNLLDWPSKSSSQLIVIAIANTMDLPERLLMGRVASRLGLTRLTFQPYTHAQLQNIVTARLSDTGAFISDAVQLVARKVAAVSGDARRALDICRRAVELAELDAKCDNCPEQVSLIHVNKALTEMIANPKVQAIKCCSRIEQLILQATAAEVQRTGIDECNFLNVYKQLDSLCAFVQMKTPTNSEVLSACCRLSSSRLIISDDPQHDIYQKILLNVSIDDVHYATKSLL